VFEQSILPNDRTNKPWSFLASISAEIAVVSLLIIVPLAYNDRLPAFQWDRVTVAAPSRRVDTPPTPARSTGSAAGPTVFHRVFDLSTIPAARDNRAVAGADDRTEPLIGIIGGVDSDGSSPIQRLIARTTVATPPPTIADPPTQTNKPINVGGDVQLAKLVKRVMPIYPALAKTARISGVVRLVGFIAKDGTIRNLQVISGHPVLTQAALAAVQQWVYKPTLLNGEPVEVIAPIDVHFTLSDR
jgi:protein TonB